MERQNHGKHLTTNFEIHFTPRFGKYFTDYVSQTAVEYALFHLPFSFGRALKPMPKSFPEITQASAVRFCTFVHVLSTYRLRNFKNFPRAV